MPKECNRNNKVKLSKYIEVQNKLHIKKKNNNMRGRRGLRQGFWQHKPGNNKVLEKT